MGYVRTPAERHADDLLMEAERAYTPAAYAVAMEAVEALPEGVGLTHLRRGAVAHALAELSSDVKLFDRAMAEYERALSLGLPPEVARVMPGLLAECRAQRDSLGR